MGAELEEEKGTPLIFQEETEMVKHVIKNLRRYGADGYYFKRILGLI